MNIISDGFYGHLYILTAGVSMSVFLFLHFFPSRLKTCGGGDSELHHSFFSLFREVFYGVAVKSEAVKHSQLC